MKTYKIFNTDLVVSRIAYGCAMLVGWDREPIEVNDIAKAARMIHAAHDSGITFFDQANLYAFGKSEIAFGQVLKQSPAFRERIIIQSKCGQYFSDRAQHGDPVHIDLSRGHIVGSAEESLRRLCTDHLDILLLHAPDALAEPEEVAQAFDVLHRSGKVRYFGVSNHTPSQIELLKKYVRQPIVTNQIHLGLAHTYPVDDGMELILDIIKGATSSDHGYTGIAGSGILDYCRLHDIQVQSWSPLRFSQLLNPPADAKPEIRRTAQLLADMARQKDATPLAVALAWLLRHPAGIVPVVGSSDPEHLVEDCAADRITLNRDEWYSLFASAARIQSRVI